MTYRTVALDDLPNAPAPAREKKEVDEAVGATAFGMNVYVADPGEELPWGYHEHPSHEEVFLVLAGELAVDTPDGEYRVEADEVFFVPPGHRNRARAVGNAPCRVVAVGAPKDEDEAIIREECPDCGTETRREYERDGEDIVLRCADCGTETKRFN